MPSTKRFTLSSLVLALAITAFSHAQSDEKLDLILSEIQALREQVADLEKRLKTVEGGELNSAAVAAAASTSNDIEPREKKTLFDQMRVELKKAEVRASGAWTEPSVWNSVKKGMSEEEVIEILGEPTHRKFSVRLDTDEILRYQGDLEGSGELIEGEIRLYKGKVRRFVVPDFPEGV